MTDAARGDLLLDIVCLYEVSGFTAQFRVADRQGEIAGLAVTSTRELSRPFTLPRHRRPTPNPGAIVRGRIPPSGSKKPAIDGVFMADLDSPRVGDARGL